MFHYFTHNLQMFQDHFVQCTFHTFPRLRNEQTNSLAIFGIQINVKKVKTMHIWKLKTTKYPNNGILMIFYLLQ